MTVLTLPFAGAAVKSDKARLLVDHQPTLSYRPERLEDGKAEKEDEDRIGGRACRALKTAAVLLAFVAFLLFAGGVLCKAYNENVVARSTVQEDLWYAAARPEDDGKPCKSYTSYAAAENDMSLLSPVVSDNYDDNNDDDDSNAAEHGKLVDDTGGRRSSSVPAATGPDDTVPPSLVATDAARFIHDFSVNVTGIVDVSAKRCFVMPLLRQSVAPPKSLFDLMFKMSSGYYSTDIKRVMANMRVVEPPVKDLSGYGLYISKDCATYSTYALDVSSVNTAR